MRCCAVWWSRWTRRSRRPRRWLGPRMKTPVVMTILVTKAMTTTCPWACGKGAHTWHVFSVARSSAGLRQMTSSRSTTKISPRSRAISLKPARSFRAESRARARTTSASCSSRFAAHAFLPCCPTQISTKSANAHGHHIVAEGREPRSDRRSRQGQIRVCAQFPRSHRTRHDGDGGEHCQVRSAAARARSQGGRRIGRRASARPEVRELQADRKSTRLNSSHANISYAVFCLKKKKRGRHQYQRSPRAGRSRSAAGAPQRRRLHPPPRADVHRPHRVTPRLTLCLFFFKGPAAPGVFPFSPPRPFPS